MLESYNSNNIDRFAAIVPKTVYVDVSQTY